MGVIAVHLPVILQGLPSYTRPILLLLILFWANLNSS